jgi:FkbM family methyltransferase
LRTRWGAARFSSHNEELLVRDFFSDMRDGFFVDIGAGDYRERSNTFFLETKRGWSGIAVDPQPEIASGYQKYRPRTKFFAMFVSDVSDQAALLHVGKNRLFSSADASFTKAYTEVDATIQAQTIRLDDLLAAEKVDRIDFLSMDVELHEPQVLAGFDVQRFRPRLVCVEAHPQVRQQILDYFTRRGYVIVGKYLRADPQNLWFSPRAD